MPTLEINNLTIFENENKIVDLFNENYKQLIIKSSLAIVGQSGSGKSLTLKSILNLLPSNLSKNFDYKFNTKLNFENIGLIPQNPFTSLSPMTKIDKQFFCDNPKINHLLKLVDLEEEVRYKFPIQLSGGQLQRVVIAIVLSKSPKLLLLDEPTTALDEKSKDIIINMIKKLQKELNFIIIFVSHDIESIKDICKDIAILKDGTIIEYGDLNTIVNNPKNNYTKELIQSNFKNREFRV
ncbi:MAG: ATP-binding cassette domain-containing protein [Campylobacterota bacterium]|nr:ATP-binding cassette domain-containing protein [Campylobacterota bacterium]